MRRRTLKSPEFHGPGGWRTGLSPVGGVQRYKGLWVGDIVEKDGARYVFTGMSGGLVRTSTVLGSLRFRAAEYQLGLREKLSQVFLPGTKVVLTDTMFVPPRKFSDFPPEDDEPKTEVGRIVTVEVGRVGTVCDYVVEAYTRVWRDDPRGYYTDLSTRCICVENGYRVPAAFTTQLPTSQNLNVVHFKDDFGVTAQRAPQSVFRPVLFEGDQIPLWVVPGVVLEPL